MTPVVSLVVVVYGSIYERYTTRMLESARIHFDPSPMVELVKLEGEPGWPNASGCRYRKILEAQSLIGGDWIFMIDADMIFEARVGPEILSDGVTVCTHPGFPDDGQADAPWNQDVPEGSAAWTPDVPRTGVHYHPGAFVGAPRGLFLELAGQLEKWIARDARDSVSPRWYDEAYLNRWLAHRPPTLVLPQEYCAWDYLGHEQPRKIVHLDKTADEFKARDLGLEEGAEAA